MKLNRATIAGITCAGAMLLLPGAASAEALKGGTSQPGKRVTVRTGADGVVDFAKITWTATCRYGGEVRGRTRFGTPFDRASAAGFRSSGNDTLKDGKYDVKLRATIEGEAKGAGYRGTFKASLRYSKHGKYVTTCKTRKVRWAAS